MSRASLAAAAVLLVPCAARAAALPDHLVQPPTLAAPAPGAVAGTAAAFAFSPGALARGQYALALPIELPEGRGAPLVGFLPSYSPDAPLSEWGMGFAARLAIQRAPLVGDVDYAANEFTSPWGRLVSADGVTFYPAGWTSAVVVRRAGDEFLAEDGQGTRYRFAVRDRVGAGYAWMLSAVTSLTGEVTTLSWTKNASGRAFLTEVTYGGRAGVAQVHVELVYELLARPLADYASGALLALDRRVQELRVEVRRAGTGAFERLSTYRIGYTAAAIGPAYYLTELTEIHRSGEVEPTLRLDYDTGLGALTGAELAGGGGFETVLAARGGTALSPERATWMDLDDDGQAELELALDYAVAARGPDGWTITTTQAAPGSSSLCRPRLGESNPARLLTRLWPGAPGAQVVRTMTGDAFASTRVLVCSAEGRSAYDQTIRGGWVLGPSTHLVDIDRDRRPDLVRVDAGGVYVLHNESGPAGPSFTPLPVAPLGLTTSPLASWIHDLNGDGVADVVVRLPGGLVVFDGLGHERWSSRARALEFLTTGGLAVPDVGSRALTFLDVNRDGLTDVLTTKSGQVALFVNDGVALRAVRVPALEGFTADPTLPTVVDLSGSGEVEIALLALSRLRTLRLTHAGTGLLRAYHDGRGIDVELGYVRAAGAPGVPQRPALLATVALRVAGLAARTVTYDYGAPVLHQIGRFLVGYEQVGKTTPLARELVTMHHDDDLSGVLLDRVETDLRRGLTRFTTRSYDEIVTHGVVRLWRPRLTRSGWRAEGREVASEVEVLAHERDVCPTLVHERGPSGLLVRETTLGRVAAVADDLHCLVEDERLRGQHADATLDFAYAVTTRRDDVGLVTEVVQHGPAGDLVRQHIDYDARHRPHVVSVPGQGATVIEYDRGTGLVQTIVAPDGSARHVNESDGVADLVRALRLDRGGPALVQSFRFDGRERLERAWDDAGLGDEAHPMTRYRYVDVSAGAPGLVSSETAVDPRTGAVTTLTQAVAGDGTALASLRSIPEGWQVLALALVDRGQGTTQRYHRGPLARGALGGRGFAEYFAGAIAVARSTSDAAGGIVDARDVIEAGVERSQVTTSRLDGDTLVVTTVENDATRTSQALRVDGELLFSEDQAGTRLVHERDALGRLVGLTLADGARHTLRYDGYGRPKEIVRSDVAIIRYAYAPVTGLVERKDVLTPDGTLERSVAYGYDDLGRVTTETHTQPATGAGRAFAYRYDGEREDGFDPGQVGERSLARGDGFVRTSHVDRRGRVDRVRLALAGFRTVEQRFDYFEDGAPRTTTWIVSDPAGRELFRTTQDSHLDADGRLAHLDVDGAPLATLAYDGEGRVERVDLTAGGTIAHEFDPITGHVRATWQDAGRWNARWETRKNVRGQIEHELVTFGDTTVDRRYGYDARGQLETASGGASAARYTYDAVGRPETTSDIDGERAFFRVGNFVLAGTHVYRYDALGRVAARDRADFVWGPSGEIDAVMQGGHETAYRYDERGERLLELIDGVPARARFGGAVLDAERLVLPVRVAGRVIGVLDVSAQGARFDPVGTDPRGTPFVDGEAFAPATPYGVRARRAALARVVDFAEHGYDEALGTVRFGVRDYDPVLGRFVSPDPVLLEDVDACAARPLECNLDGYAAGDPLRYVDPSGAAAFEMPVGAFERQPGVSTTTLGSPLASVAAYAPGLPGSVPLPLVAVTIASRPMVHPPAVSDVRLRGKALEERPLQILSAILARAGLSSATITSTARTLADQARIMYDNIQAKGLKSQYELYAAAGDKVIDVYVAHQNETRAEVIARMETKANELTRAGQVVSKHCSEKYWVVDISPGSIKDAAAFRAAVEYAKANHEGVSKLIPPGDDPAWHIEMPKASQASSNAAKPLM